MKRWRWDFRVVPVQRRNQEAGAGGLLGTYGIGCGKIAGYLLGDGSGSGNFSDGEGSTGGVQEVIDCEAMALGTHSQAR